MDMDMDIMDIHGIPRESLFRGPTLQMTEMLRSKGVIRTLPAQFSKTENLDFKKT